MKTKQTDITYKTFSYGRHMCQMGVKLGNTTERTKQLEGKLYHEKSKNQA